MSEINDEERVAKKAMCGNLYIKTANISQSVSINRNGERGKENKC